MRLFFLISEMVMIFILMNLGNRYPDLLVIHDSDVLFLDNLIQIPITLIASSVLLIYFSNSFRAEQVKLQTYSTVLEETNKELLHMTISDDLTGLYNRRYFFEKSQEYWNQLYRYQSVRIALVDVDNFKKVNDTFGHVIGDQVLKEISSIMSSRIYGDHFVSRYGGDEFVMVFLDLSLENTMEILNQINHEISNIDVKGQKMISLSGGVTQLTLLNNVDEALRRADLILYQTKNGLKNSICSDVE